MQWPLARLVKICCPLEMQRLASVCGEEQLLSKPAAGCKLGACVPGCRSEKASGGTAIRQHIKSRLAAVCPIPVACVGRWRIYRYGQPLIAKEARVNHFSV